jgi:hypothetical protein
MRSLSPAAGMASDTLLLKRDDPAECLAILNKTPLKLFKETYHLQWLETGTTKPEPCH